MAVYEDFEGISTGVTVTSTNTNFSAAAIVSGTWTATCENSDGGGPIGAKFLRIGIPTTSSFWSISDVSTAEATQWSTFFYRQGSTPPSNALIVKAYTNTSTSLFEFRSLTTGQIALREAAGTYALRGTVACAANEWHRVALMVSPNATAGERLRMKVYSGANLLTSTPTYDSGLVDLNQVSATTVNSWRWGTQQGLTGGTWQVDYDDVRVASTEWLPAESGSPVTYGRHIVIGG